MKITKLFSVFIVCSMFLVSCNDDAPGTIDPLYDNVPNIAGCTPGSLSKAEKLKVLTYINSVRATHNLPAVVYDSTTTRERLAQEAALIGAANGSISENIAESDECYSANAASECRNGNRSLWGNASSKWPSSEIHINDWLTELDSTGLNSGKINNRRRLLDPFLQSVTFGRVIGAPKKGEFKYVSSAVLLTGYKYVDLSSFQAEYIAYPQGNYSAKLFDPKSFLSFSVLYDKSVKSNNSIPFIDFSETTVEVSAGTQKLDIVEGVYDYNNVGLPNNLRWKVQGLAKNVSYTVKIDNVKVGGEIKNYEYTFVFK
ncbi:MAG: CAP domain-containing protein [Prevotellaceae bacterium]|jgi:hypothetical protein|nr:CAP domain-containing protein [Prevotellaceae bacterium]